MRSHLAALLLLLCGPGCPSSSPSALDSHSRGAEGGRSLISIKEKGNQPLLYTFFDERAEMRTVDQRGQIAETARAEVMVTDPKRGLGGDLIYVADLRQPSASGEYRVWIEERGAWLDRVMPKSTKLPSSALAEATRPPTKQAQPPARRPPRRAHLPRRPATSASAALRSPSEAGRALQETIRRPRVVLYETSGCGYCRMAKQYFTARRIEFLERDIESDQAALKDYVSVCNASRIQPGGVPLIVIGRRVLSGFTEGAVAAALAAEGIAPAVPSIRGGPGPRPHVRPVGPRGRR